MFKRKNNKKGFTIVELTIVVSVIAILSAVLIPTFAGVTKKARQTADEAAVRNMNTALAQKIEVENPDIFDVSTALSENGFAAENGLFPTLKDHAFYWHKPSNTIVYVKTKDGAFDLVFPKNVKDFSENTCQALGTKISAAAAVAPAAPADTTAKPAGTTANMPADIDTFEELVEWSNGSNGKVETTLPSGAKKEGVAFSGNIKLTEDLVLGKKGNAGRSMAYNITGDTTIDLNGFSITQANAGTGQSLAFFAVRSGVTLTIIDSSTAKTGAIKVGNTAFQIDAGATVNMYSGTITLAEDRSAADIAYGASLVWTYGGTFNMYGGTLDVASTDFDLNWAISNSGVANLFAGKVVGYIDESANIYDITK
ncbi:MAG: type II secretion system protein [Clostridiales bacterium]|nr:type II secretion system protein [Clostridiales bacterium]